VFRFIHLAFQEFLVARYLSEVIGRESRDAILTSLDGRLDDPWWREPILLLAGYMGANAAKSSRDFLAALAKSGKTATAQVSAAELAGTAAQEWRESGETIRSTCAQRIVDLLRDANIVEQTDPVVRAQAGDALSRLGDPRFARNRFHLPADKLLGFVRIPADPDFGTSEFYIGQYLVTVAQFRAFVDATTFSLREPRPLLDPDSRPVCSITWHEALAYCNWLNDILATSRAMDSCEISQQVRKGHLQVTLPSEPEWEKAARKGRSTTYPWGDEPNPNFANYKLKNSSSVGCFPANGFGLYDIVGNAWQWTRSVWGTYPYRPDESRERLDAGEKGPRAVRGGAFNHGDDVIRIDHRNWYTSDSDSIYVGFRVALCPIRPIRSSHVPNPSRGSSVRT
jgi:hypothetical protein